MSTPRCPNHKVPMSGTDNRRIWICPVSDARFECDVDTAERNKQHKVNLAGAIEEVAGWVIKPGDGTVRG